MNVEQLRQPISDFILSLPKGTVVQFVGLKPKGASEAVYGLFICANEWDGERVLETINTGVSTQRKEQFEDMMKSFNLRRDAKDALTADVSTPSGD